MNQTPRQNIKKALKARFIVGRSWFAFLSDTSPTILGDIFLRVRERNPFFQKPSNQDNLSAK